MTDEKVNAALQVAKAVAVDQGDGIVTLSTGYRARLKPVATSLVTDAIGLIKDPPVPVWHNPDKDRDEPNPFDPEYNRIVAANDTLRGAATMDVMVYFGVELLDGLPDDLTWLKKLKYMEKRGRLDLSSYDTEDPIDREFLFLRYIAVAQEDLEMVMTRSGITTEGVNQAKAQFPSDTERAAN